MKKKSLYSLCRHDLYLAAGLAAAAALLFAALLLFRGDSQGNAVVITVNGSVYGTWPLNQDQDIVVDTDLGHNVVRISGGTVSMLEADCPDGYCMSKGAIIHNRDTIVCLPHRVVVEIRKQETETMAFDAISQ